MAKVKTTKKHRAGLKFQTVIGEIEYNQDCIAIVSDSKVDELIESAPGDYELIEKDGVEVEHKQPEKPVIDTDEEIKSNPPANPEIEAEKQRLAERQAAMKELMRLDIEMLKQFCKDKELPESEWSDMKKPQLVTYLIDK